MAYITRRSFLRNGTAAFGGVALGGGLLTACGGDEEEGSADAGQGSAPAAQDVALGMNWIKNIEFGGYYIAIEDGHYADEGVKLELVPGGPNAPESVQMVASGTAQIGISTDLMQVFDTIQKGTPLVMFAAKFQQSPAGLASLPDNPVRTARDIVGKRIGGPQGDQRFLDAVLQANGLQKGDYEFVPTGFDPQPLAEGEVEALSVFVTNQPLTLRREGTEVVAVTFAEMGLPSYADVLYAEREYIDANRDAVIGFLRGTIMGWEAFIQDPERAATLAVEDYGADLGLEVESQTEEGEAMIPLLQSDLTEQKGLFWISADELGGPMYDGLAATGRKNLPPVDEVLDLTLLEDAYGGKSSLL